MRKFLLVGLVCAVFCSANATYMAEAFNNATIQTSGVRQGTSGLAFWNIEGSGNGTFASWGVSDFHADDFLFSGFAWKVFNFKVVLTEADAAFTHPGRVDFWLSMDTTTSIMQAGSPLIWQTGVNPSGCGSQLPLIPLGESSFNTTGNTASGQVDTYSFNLNPMAQALIVNALNTHGTIRLVATPNDVTGDPLVAATFAGYTHTTYAGPTLRFDVLPTLGMILPHN